jgi:oxygen-dependent protoporphyrinogen oxidase
VAFRKKLHPVPEGFILLAPTRMWPIVTSAVLSPFGKLRMALDMVLPATDQKFTDESLASFVSRRFGKEVLDRLAQPLLGGIYGADPELLSLRATMPQFLEAEQQSGSVMFGLRQAQRSEDGSRERRWDKSESGARYSMFVSIDKGMSVLVNTLIGKLPENTLKTSTPLLAISRSTAGWELTFEDGQTESFDFCILAIPAWESARVIREIDSSLADDLASIEYVSSAVINFVFDREQISHALDGFGFVVPEIEHRTITASSFFSIKFPGRTKDNQVVVRVFLGNTLHPEVYELDDQEMKQRALLDLSHYLGISGTPKLSWLRRWPRSMPQYEVGHLDLVSRIRRKLERLPGLLLAGNAFEGVGIPDCVRSGENAARMIIDQIRKRS